jgi:hypothetical protein
MPRAELRTPAESMLNMCPNFLSAFLTFSLPCPQNRHDFQLRQSNSTVAGGWRVPNDRNWSYETKTCAIARGMCAQAVDRKLAANPGQDNN